MATLIFNVNPTDPDAEDRRGMDLAINRENARRAALVPPGTPLPQSTNVERRASYGEILAARLLESHLSLIKEANDLAWKNVEPRWLISTDAQRLAAANQLAPLP